MFEKNLYVISGAHGSGKSTLVKRVSDHLKETGVPFVSVSEVARLCPYPVGEKSTSLAQQWILYHQAFTEIILGQLRLPVILDRCVVDHYSYYIHWNAGPEIFLESFLDRYQRVFKLPARREFLVSDGLRPIDIEYQRKIDRVITAMYGKSDRGKDWYVNLDPTKDESIALVEREVRRYTKGVSSLVRWPDLGEVVNGELEIVSTLDSESVSGIIASILSFCGTSGYIVRVINAPDSIKKHLVEQGLVNT